MKPRHQLLILALLSIAPQVAAQIAPETLAPEMEAWLERANRIARGKWGVVVADQTGKILWQVNGNEPMIPASTVKVLTTGFARTAVGGEARRATRVVGDGHVDSTGTWIGRWALEVNGDVTLERPDRGGPMLSTLAQQLAAIGVRRLIGTLSLTTGQGEAKSVFPSVWSDRYRGHLYAPPIGPVTLNENTAQFTISPGARVGALPIVTGEAPTGIANLLTNKAKTVSGRSVRLRLSPQINGRWTLTGTIGLRSTAHRYSTVVNDPTSVLEASWLGALTKAGIQWIRSPTIGSRDAGPQRVLAEIASESFDSVAHEINTRSLNIGAELLLRWGGGPDNAADRLMEHVRLVTGLNEVHLVDGSGLSTEDRVSPVVFTTYLAKFPLTPAGRNFAMLLPANGSGTLRRLASGLPGPGVVRAKTGTLGNAATLVGYLGRSDGTLVIAVMYNGGAPGSAHQAEWDLFRRLGANGVVIPSDDAVAGGSGGGPQ